MWRSCFLVAGIVATTVAEAQELPAPAPGPAPAGVARPARKPAGRPPRRGDVGTFVLRDGRRIDGELVVSSEHGDVIALPEGRREFLPGRSVVAVVPKDDRFLTAWDALPPDGVVVRLRDGSVVEGRLLEHGGETVELQGLAGERRSLGVDEVAEAVVPEGPLPSLRSRAAVARTRALWTPTAFLLEPGEMLATSSELLTAWLAAGVLPVAMLSAGTTVPAGYARDFGSNVSLDAKVGFEFLPWLHVAGGVSSYLSSEGDLVSGYLALTAGWPDRYLTLFAGPPPPGAHRLGHFGDRIFSAAACWRLGPRLALLGEGWLGRASRKEMLGALGARFLWSRFSLDVGAATATAEALVPFLALSFTLLPP